MGALYSEVQYLADQYSEVDLRVVMDEVMYVEVLEVQVAVKTVEPVEVAESVVRLVPPLIYPLALFLIL